MSRENFSEEKEIKIRAITPETIGLAKEESEIDLLEELPFVLAKRKFKAEEAVKIVSGLIEHEQIKFRRIIPEMNQRQKDKIAEVFKRNIQTILDQPEEEYLK